MKKKFIFRTGSCLLWLLPCIFCGCQKIFDYTHLPGNGDAALKVCRISKINSSRANYVFNYNKKGDPESIITNQVTEGNPNIFFIYDKKGRLQQLLRPYATAVNSPNITYETWERFGYNAAGLVVKDTVFHWGRTDSDGSVIPSSALFGTFSIFVYDSNNRLIKKYDSAWSTLETLPPGISSSFYYYDNRGNLGYITQGSADTLRFPPYDNMINYRWTNKLWSFIDKNYSVNNPFTATSYNTYGLPLNFEVTLYQHQQTLGVIAPYVGPQASIEYECK